MWPWARVRRDIADARQRADDAEQQRVDDELRTDAATAILDGALQQAEKSRAATARLRRQVDKNGFTELLSDTWMGRGHAT